MNLKKCYIRLVPATTLLLLPAILNTNPANANEAPPELIQTINKKTYIKQTGYKIPKKQIFIDGPFKPSFCETCKGTSWDVGMAANNLKNIHTNIRLNTFKNVDDGRDVAVNLATITDTAFQTTIKSSNLGPAAATAFKYSNYHENLNQNKYTSTHIAYPDIINPKNIIEASCMVKVKNPNTLPAAERKAEKCATKVAKYAIKTYYSVQTTKITVTFNK